MKSIDKFWNHVSILQKAIDNSDSTQQRNWWLLRLANFMLKLECYESKTLN